MSAESIGTCIKCNTLILYEQPFIKYNRSGKFAHKFCTVVDVANSIIPKQQFVLIRWIKWIWYWILDPRGLVDTKQIKTRVDKQLEAKKKLKEINQRYGKRS